MPSGFRIETLDRSGRWYLSPGTRSIYDLRIRNETREEVDCLLHVEDPPSGVRVDPPSCILRGSEVRTVTVILEGDAPVARSQRVVVALRTAAGEELARFEHPVVITGGSDCSLTLALEDVLWEAGQPQGVVVSCTVRSQSEATTSFALGVTPHPSLRVAPVEPLRLDPGETARVVIPVSWDRTVRDEQGRNHPATLEVGVAVSNGRRTGRIRWDLIEEKLRSAEREGRRPLGAHSPPTPSAEQTPAAAAKVAPGNATHPATKAGPNCGNQPVAPPAGTEPDRRGGRVTHAATVADGTVGALGSLSPQSVTDVRGDKVAVEAGSAAQGVGREPTSNGAPAAQAAVAERNSSSSAGQRPDAPSVRATQRFDQKCLPNPDSHTAVAAGAVGSAGTVYQAIDGEQAPVASALAELPAAVATPTIDRRELEAALTARPSDFAQSVRVRRASGNLQAAAPRRLPAGIAIGVLASLTVAAGVLVFKTAPAGHSAASPATTPATGTETAAQPAADVAGTATTLVARPASKAPGSNAVHAVKARPAARRRAAMPVSTPQPTATPRPSTPSPARTPAAAAQAPAAAPARPVRAAPRAHPVVRPMLDAPPPGPVVALGGIEAYYGPRGHVVRVFWSAAQQVSAVVQLLNDSGRVISATRVAGHRQQALLYLPRRFHGALTVMVSSVGRMGERVAQTTSLPPFGY